MHHHLFRNYRIISVMFWAFPYLLWQAFGHWSGFAIGVIVAIVLTMMLNDLFYAGCSHTLSATSWRPFQRAKNQPRDENEEQYCTEGHLYCTGEHQPQHEEIKKLYPRAEMPPRKVT